MSPHTRHEAAAPTGAEITTLYVAIEISRKSWVVGIKSPLGEKIGLHTLGAADVASLRACLSSTACGRSGRWVRRWPCGCEPKGQHLHCANRRLTTHIPSREYFTLSDSWLDCQPPCCAFMITTKHRFDIDQELHFRI